MNITMQLIADEAGVSKALVSKYLSNAPDARMRENTRHRIAEVIRKYNYRPSRLAGSLRSGKSRTIGMVISELRNLFWAQFADLALREAQSHGYRLLLSVCDFGEKEGLERLQSLREYRVDGVIFCEQLPSSKLTQQLEAEHFPMMLMYQKSESFATVKVQYRDSLSRAVRFLKKQGEKDLFAIHSQYSDWPEIIMDEAVKLGISATSQLVPLAPDELIPVLRKIAGEKHPVIFLNGWRTTVLLLQLLNREFPEYRPKLITNDPFGHPAFTDEKVAGLIRSDFPELVKSTVRNLIARMENPALEPKEYSFPSVFIPGSEIRQKAMESNFYFPY